MFSLISLHDGKSDVSEHATRLSHHGQRFHPYRVKFRHITRTHVIRTQKTARFQRIENSRIRHMRTTPYKYNQMRQMGVNSY